MIEAPVRRWCLATNCDRNIGAPCSLEKFAGHLGARRSIGVSYGYRDSIEFRTERDKRQRPGVIDIGTYIRIEKYLGARLAGNRPAVSAIIARTMNRCNS